MTDPRTLGLHDILLPEPVGFWPPPWPFWLALGLVATVLLVGGWRLAPRVRRWRRRRLALATWRGLAKQHESPEACAAALNRLLKNVAAAAGEPHVAALSGGAWSTYLKARLPAADHALLEQFLDSIYRPQAHFDPARLRQAAPRWIRRLA